MSLSELASDGRVLRLDEVVPVPVDSRFSCRATTKSTTSAARSRSSLARNFIEGAFLGSGTYYRVVGGDDAEPVETLQKILEHRGKADIIIPYHLKVAGRGWGRRAISRLHSMLVNPASGRRLHYYNGLPLYRRRDVLGFHSIFKISMARLRQATSRKA